MGLLRDDDLVLVSGGANSATYEKKKKEFEKAWENLNMDALNISGQQMAAYMDEWEEEGYKTDINVFLKSKKV